MPQHRLRILGFGAALVHSVALWHRGAANPHFEVPLFIFAIIVVGILIEHYFLSKFDWSYPAVEVSYSYNVERFASYFKPLVILLAAMSAYAHFAFFQAPPERALNIFISVLLCASPTMFEYAISSALAIGSSAVKERGGESRLEFNDMILKQAQGNVFLAFAYNGVALAFAVCGRIPPLRAVEYSVVAGIILLRLSWSLGFRIRNWG